MTIVPSMRPTPMQRFLALLEQQAGGSRAAVAQLRALRPSRRAVRCLQALHGEWSSAFSYEPGRVEALVPLISLARKASGYQLDDILRLYREPEWAELVRLRGPVESVALFKCPQCGRVHPVMMMSGFLDETGLVCLNCGDVYFKSLYDDTPTPRCTCGGVYGPDEATACPHCGGTNLVEVGYISPYEYFAKHRFVRDPQS